jgi:hypothetical protein
MNDEDDFRIGEKYLGINHYINPAYLNYKYNNNEDQHNEKLKKNEIILKLNELLLKGFILKDNDNEYSKIIKEAKNILIDEGIEE